VASSLTKRKKEVLVERSEPPDAQPAADRTPRRRPSTNLAMREESIRRLSNAAFRLIVSNGYQATSLSEIAEAAGLTKGAFFFYFNSKENMLLRLLDIVEANIVDPTIQRLQESGGSAPEKIAEFFRFTSQHGVSRPQELLTLILVSVEFRNRDDAVGERVSHIYDRLYQCLEEVLEMGRSRGEIAKTVRIRELASMMIATHDGMMLEWHRRGTKIDGGQLARTVMSTFMRGVIPQP
jgi:AcrR family transcriptional regulator